MRIVDAQIHTPGAADFEQPFAPPGLTPLHPGGGGSTDG